MAEPTARRGVLHKKGKMTSRRIGRVGSIREKLTACFGVGDEILKTKEKRE
jgi:hypothetical protein